METEDKKEPVLNEDNDLDLEAKLSDYTPGGLSAEMSVPESDYGMTGTGQGQSKENADAGIEDEMNSSTRFQALTLSLLGMSEKLVQLLEGVNILTGRLKVASTNYEHNLQGYRDLVVKKEKQMFIVLGAALSVILICLGTTLIMSFSFSKQVTNMNALSVSLAKRISEVNSGLVTFEELGNTVSTVNNSILELALEQQNTQNNITAVKSEVLAATAQQLESTKLLISDQISNLLNAQNNLRNSGDTTGRQIDGLAESIQGIQSDFGKLSSQMEQLGNLNASVQALITLERAKYLDAIQQRSAAESSNPEVKSDDQSIRFSRE
jgi:prefoldin subunit 5